MIVVYYLYIFCIYFYFKVPHIFFESFPLMCLLTSWLNKKKKKRNINNDLATWLSYNSLHYVQTLRALYLHGILLPWGLFIAKRSTLKRASWWSLKRMITSSGSQDISNLVSGDLVITDWSADNSVNTDCLEMLLVSFERSF